MWSALGHPSWATYALAEFGIGRSTAHWLLDLAAVAEAVESTVARELGAPHAALALPVRAVVVIKGPGRQAGEPMSPEALREHLRAAGISPQSGRVARRGPRPGIPPGSQRADRTPIASA
ncbi:hypothetical protein [Kitasatospora sp. NPDC050543]|uniref:hypothetical protein n=1 Tax=Kitasatospora sp. NPDC050543 TaxID=3364054 RepID=UPI0037B2ACDD